MSKLLKLIENDAVPQDVRQKAAQGTLPLPLPETLEVLTYLTRDPKLGQQAARTLTDWNLDEISAQIRQMAVSQEVLAYFLGPENPRLTPLLSKLAQDGAGLEATVGWCPAPAVQVILGFEQLRCSVGLLNRLLHNPNLLPAQAAQARALLQRIKEEEEKARLEQAQPAQPADPTEEEQFQAQIDEWMREHAAEIAAEEGSEFELIGGLTGDEDPGKAAKVDLEALAGEAKKGSIDAQRLSTLQKLSKMPVSERIQAAMKGSREERSILIRDSSKLVCLAVLASPKVSASEIESIACMKNVKEDVLRELVRNRKYRKNYVVMKNLCNNGKTPLDMVLRLMNDLHPIDLRQLAMNKNVADTVRKLAGKKFHDKAAGHK